MTHAHDSLETTVRDILGKAAAKFRYEGRVPAVVYGQVKKSVHIWVDAIAFGKLFKKAGFTSVIDVVVDGKKIPVLVKDIQIHPLKSNITHIDFLQVNLKKLIIADVPVVLIGEAPVIKTDNGIVITIDETVTIEALPDNMPHSIEVDASILDHIGAKITAANLPTSDIYTIKDIGERIFFAVTAHKEQSEESETEVVMPEVTTEKAAAEGSEEASTS
jgi:large subunit ribosomal protein L25